MKTAAFLLALAVALPCLSQTLPASAPPSPTRDLRASNASLQATFAANGSYSIAFPAAGWQLTGALPSPVTALRSTSGTDRIGPYSQLSATWDAGTREAEIRVYHGQPLVLLSDVWLRAGANQQPFPTFAALPSNAFRFSFRKESFGLYEFGRLGAQGPWTFFDRDEHALILSPADHFLISAMDDNAAADSRIVPAIGSLPAGFSHGTLIAVGHGINPTYSVWGAALLRLGGKHRPSSHADVTLAKLGYWTDNFATYYYKFVPQLGYRGTLLAVRDEFRRLNIPLGYMQLDSWFYPKGPQAAWTSPPPGLAGGEYLYRADQQLFPSGLAAFQHKLALPLVTHARWISPASPYHHEYKMSGNVVIDPRFWSSTAAYLHHAGVVTYEQDWLNQNSQTAVNLHDPARFLSEMNRSMATDGLTIQYCMPLPADYMASTHYSAVQTIRTSDDGFRRARWDEFLYDSRLAAALGLWPFTDNFYSHDLGSLIIADLSGGPVADADALGQVDVPNLMATLRGDGVLIKPDQPLLPIESTYLNDAQSRQKPMIAAARTFFPSTQAVYLFAYPRRPSDSGVTVPLESLGLTQAVYAWNWTAHTGRLIPAGGSVPMTFADGWAYDVLVPVAPDGLALVGEPAKVATLGRERIAALHNGRSLSATVLFAPDEKSLELTGYAAARPSATAHSGKVTLESYDPQSHRFVLKVWPGSARRAAITLLPQR